MLLLQQCEGGGAWKWIPNTKFTVLRGEFTPFLYGFVIPNAAVVDRDCMEN